MKINIQLDITPEEMKDLFTPNENQAKLWMEIFSEFYKSLQDTDYNDEKIISNYIDLIQRNREKFLNELKKKQ